MKFAFLYIWDSKSPAPYMLKDQGIDTLVIKVNPPPLPYYHWCMLNIAYEYLWGAKSGIRFGSSKGRLKKLTWVPPRGLKVP